MRSGRHMNRVLCGAVTSHNAALCYLPRHTSPREGGLGGDKIIQHTDKLAVLANIVTAVFAGARLAAKASAGRVLQALGSRGLRAVSLFILVHCYYSFSSCDNISNNTSRSRSIFAGCVALWICFNFSIDTWV